MIPAMNRWAILDRPLRRLSAALLGKALQIATLVEIIPALRPAKMEMTTHGRH
jgi:hypothetical protein